MNKWDKEEIELLTTFLEMRYTHKEIAQELDRTIEAISKKCSRLNLHTINGSGGIDPTKKAFTYLVYLPTLNLYKVGITNKTTRDRLVLGLNCDDYEPILEHKFTTGKEARELELEWLENVKEFKVNTGLLNSGNTETFRL